MSTLPTDPRARARRLYAQGWRVSAIARHLKVKRTTVASWQRRDGWKPARLLDRVAAALVSRLTTLIAKDTKAGQDFKEMDLLGRQVERLAHPAVDSGKTSGIKKSPRNGFSDAQHQQLRAAFLETLFDYQKVWYQQRHQRTRNLLKSRQIGATWYFAREALVDALDTGRHQIFLSASRAQAHVFRQYLIQFAQAATDVELRGDPLRLSNGATLYFLSTNARTAQSYHGNLYFDEYFWVPQFTTLNQVASGMAIQAQWHKTYFSTPSTLSHEAYPFWSGAHWNRGRVATDQVHLDVSHAALAHGRLCEDRQWRQIVTVEDAIAGGCDLFHLETLKQEYSAEEYGNLLRCQFIDDTASVFTFAELQRCRVDAWEVWDDFKPLAARPFGTRPVWIGYDPSLSRDAAGCVVVAPPSGAGGPFRVLEKHQWRGLDFEAQAAQIQQLTQRYHVTYIGLDTTGLGQGVFQLVRRFFPAVTGFNYSPEVKSRLVLKGQAVIRRGRLTFEASWTDLIHAFLAIRPTLTARGRHVTYHAHRSETTGHADLAWACLHALDHEPFDGPRPVGFMEIA